MEASLILIQKVAMMFLLAAVGFILFRTKKITMEGNKTIANILIYISLPCVIINGFRVERTPERLTGLLISALAAAVALVISIVVSKLCFRKDGIAAFASACANPGFFGIPLIISFIGSGAVFYVAALIAMLNMTQWTWGVSTMTGKKGSITLKRVFSAPFMVGIIVGLFLFFTQLQLPEIITSSLTNLAALNTPLAMFTVGVYLAQSDIVHIFTNKKLYAVSAVRLLLIPVICGLLLRLLPAQFPDLKLALLIACACPVGSNIAVYAQLHNCDYTYSVETVVLSTLLSIITIPIIVGVLG